MDLQILRQTTDTKTSVHTTQDSMRSFQAEMNRRFESLRDYTDKRLDDLQALMKHHINSNNSQLGSVNQRIGALADKMDHCFEKLNHELRQRFDGTNDSIDGINQLTKQQFDGTTKLLQNLQRHSDDQTSVRDHKFQELDQRMDSCVDEISGTLNEKLVTVTNNLQGCIEAVDLKAANLEYRFENARLATLDENVQRLFARVHELKVEMQAG